MPMTYEERERMKAVAGAINATTGRKDDSQKARFDLIPPLIEKETAEVLTFGAVKYGDDNWARVPELEKRYMAAARRHLNAHARGELRDSETGRLHLAHAICCLMFIGEAQLSLPLPANGGAE